MLGGVPQTVSVIKKSRGRRDQYELDCPSNISSSDAIGIESHGRIQICLEEREGVPSQGGYRLGVLDSERSNSSPGFLISIICVMIGKLGASLGSSLLVVMIPVSTS